MYLISELSPLEKERGPLFRQTWIPLPKDDFWQVSFKLVQWFCKKKMKMWNLYKDDDNDDDENNNNDGQRTKKVGA